jgi:hypothetical protein
VESIGEESPAAAVDFGSLAASLAFVAGQVVHIVLGRIEFGEFE